MAGPVGLKVGVVVFRREADGRLRYLLLQRPQRQGGWWAVVTGSAERGESAEQAARRETQEETGIITFLRVIDLAYTHTFRSRGRTYQEPYFAIEVPPDSPVRLSYEHVAYQWTTADEAIRLLHWPHWREVVRRTEQMAAQTT
ncbi:Dihydroneopterin triphosphate diphosphatase [bacterium HR23]|nr:Dihydroneopterin triphosphate diphosphatase [bacterium HR23]